jgi:uncharacterized DUF497 family protein
MLKFEWDGAKAKANAAKHGVSFEDAKEAFRDPFALELIDDRFNYGEERLVLIAMTRLGCLTVVHVERGEVSRIVSARPATRTEEDAYFQAQSR